MSTPSEHSGSDFFHNFNKLNLLFQIFGLTALRYSYKSGHFCYNISYFLILHSIILSILNMYIFYIQITSWYPKGHNILLMLYTHLVTSSAIMSLCVIVTGVFNSFTFCKLMNSRKFSEVLSRPRSHKRVLLAAIRQFCLSFAICTFCYASDFSAYAPDYSIGSMLMILSYFIFPIYNFLCLSQFYITLFWLQCLFSDLNHELSGILDKKNEEFSYRTITVKSRISESLTSDQSRVCYDIQTLRALYQFLYELSILINKAYSTRNLFLICHHCIMSILFLYWALRHTVPEVKLPIVILLNLYRCFLTSLISILWIIWRCRNTQSEVYKTVILVQELLLSESLSKSETEELQIFSMQLLQEEVVFSPFGFFMLSSKTLLSIIGTMASYLVILFQNEGLYKPVTHIPNNYTNFLQFNNTNNSTVS